MKSFNDGKYNIIILYHSADIDSTDFIRYYFENSKSFRKRVIVE